MYLKHLSINGFKSFAKKSELEFSSPITAIVGPNGSGKSNVAESFRFVLGEQSVKSLRGKKGEDLIWGGTEGVSRGNRAGVTITLDNSRKVFPVDFEEVILERVVHRDGQNEYLINGSKVRLKDVQETLAAANIGPTGHHIISQGEADRIISTSAKERREMIEDALGLKVYQFKKQEAERKLKKTKENIEKVESLRREVAPHLKFLERQIKKIERSIVLRTELSSFYKDYLRREDVYLAHHTDRLTAERREPAAKLETLAKELQAAKTTLAEAEQDEKRDALVSAEESLAKVRQERQELVRQIGQIEGQVSFLERRIAAEKQRTSQKSERPIPYKDVEEIIASVEREVDKSLKQEDSNLLQRSLSDVIHTLKRWLAKTSVTEVYTTEAEEAELSALQKQKATQETNLHKVTEAETTAQAVYNEVQAAIESEASESRAAEREVFRIVNEERECEHSINQIDAELAVLERDRDEFKRELQEAVALIGRAAAEYFTYEIKDGDRILKPADLAAADRSQQRERRRELEKMKIRLEELGGANEDIEKEYQDVKERDDFLVHEISDLTTSVTKLEELIADINEQLNERFVAGIETISTEFNRFFTLMFGGGSAELLRVKPKVKKSKLTDEELLVGLPIDEEGEEEVVEEGIELGVKLPNKRVSGLEMLSGGERALTSIALIFAMSQVNPPLFIILDETDAALDEANSRRYGDMIEALAEKSQLILITHNRETMSRAGILYGVTMGADGVSKLLSVKFAEAAAVAK